MRYSPNRGDVVWLQWTLQAGHEQAGRRPVPVLSPASCHGRVGLALFCSITSQVKGYPFEVRVPPDLTLVGAILADQIKSLDWRVRRAASSCALPADVVDAVT